MEALNLIEMIDPIDVLAYFLNNLKNLHIFFVLLIFFFYKKTYDFFDYMKQYILYILFIVIVIFGDLLSSTVENQLNDEKLFNIFNIIYYFLIYNILVEISIIIIINYAEFFTNIWSLIKFIIMLVFRPIISLINFFDKNLFKPSPIISNTTVVASPPQNAQAKHVSPKTIRSKPISPNPIVVPNVHKKPQIKQVVTKSRDSSLNILGVYTSTNKKIDLNAKHINKGGEALIHETYKKSASIAKIFNNKAIDLKEKETVLKKLQNANLSNSVVTPNELIYNQDKSFIGYTMKRKDGIELGLILVKKITDYFPNYTLIDVIELCITLINVFKSINNESIIVGDINPRNILVKSKSTIYLIDVDSFQMGKPSPAYKEEYRRKKYYNKDIRSYMRSISDDAYAITTIIFQILHYGMLPYGGDDEESLKNAVYIFNPYYQTKYITKEKMLISAHLRLSQELKITFNDVFKKEKYVDISILKKQLQAYRRMLLKYK